MFDGHFDTLWARYSPGRLIECAVLQQLVAEDRYDTVDWMLGVASEKILVSTGAKDAFLLTVFSLLPKTQSDAQLLGASALI